MYMSTKEAAAKWGISERRVRILCSEGRIDGAVHSSWAWLIPRSATKPADGRQLRRIGGGPVRLGSGDLEAIEKQRELTQFFAVRASQGVVPFVSTALAIENIDLSTEQLEQLYRQHSFLDGVPYEAQMLAIAMRSTLISMIQKSGVIPPAGLALDSLYQLLTFGFVQDSLPLIRSDDEVADRLEALKRDDERTYKQLHPVHRAALLFANVIRIAPYSRYNALVAALLYARTLIEAGYTPALIERDRIDELRAALVMVKSREHYDYVIELLVEALGSQ
jgi:hypothetical protein